MEKENQSVDTGHPESGHSSPLSHENEFENLHPLEDPQSNYKVKFMCSYGGKIQPRAHDNQLLYIGGDTKILAVDRNIKFDSLLSKTITLCDSASISLKYQLPGEDLDALISVMNDDDLEHLMNEYDRLYRISPNPVRLRIFIFPSQNVSLNSLDRGFEFDEMKTEKERFVEALNSAPIFTAPPPAPAASPANNVDFLFGLDNTNVETAAASAPPTFGGVQELEDQVTLTEQDKSLIGSDPIQKHIQDLERLRIEEQNGIYQRKNDENLSGDYNKIPDKLPHVHVPFLCKENQFQNGVFPVHNEQQFYIIPASAYHAAMMRPVNGAPTQGYYAVHRMPQTGMYRDQIYNMIPQGAYAQVAYDSNAGRQVVYSAPGGVLGAPAPQFQGLVSADTRPAGALNVEAGMKVAPKATV